MRSSRLSASSSKLYVGITMLAMVQNMELAEEEEEEDLLFNVDACPPDAQDQARAPMAPLGSLCTDAVRAQVDGGSKKDGVLYYGTDSRSASLFDSS